MSLFKSFNCISVRMFVLSVRMFVFSLLHLTTLNNKSKFEIKHSSVFSGDPTRTGHSSLRPFKTRGTWGQEMGAIETPRLHFYAINGKVELPSSSPLPQKTDKSWLPAHNPLKAKCDLYVMKNISCHQQLAAGRSMVPSTPEPWDL